MSSCFDGVLGLGRKLVAELGLESGVDTLGRWMAHYIAELIEAAENAPPVERAVCQKRCFDAILDLWCHRAELPNGSRPFEDLEPIVRAIESLDPDNEASRYLGAIGSTIVKSDEKSETQVLLEIVRRLDLTARDLIGYFLSKAARSAVDKSKDWVVKAKEGGADLGGIDIVIQYVSGKGDREAESDPSKYEREQLQKRIQRLETLTKLVTTVHDDLKMQLNTLPPPANQTPKKPS